MPTHLGGDCEQTPFALARQKSRSRKVARSLRALTERPACFEIDPRGVRSSAPIGYGCRTQLITAYNCGSISSSRCQTTCTARSRIDAIQIHVHGRVVLLAAPGPPSLRFGVTAFAATWLAKPKPRSGEGWWSQTGSNRRPPACKAGALPTELWPRLRTLRALCGGPGKTRTSDLTLIKRAL